MFGDPQLSSTISKAGRLSCSGWIGIHASFWISICEFIVFKTDTNYQVGIYQVAMKHMVIAFCPGTILLDCC